ncbi:MAG TPA: HmuY family protein [Salinibacter sp.]|nr:HmuY family protein [Salinibacter sp.]
MQRLPTILAVFFIGGALVLTGCDSAGVDGDENEEDAPLQTIRVEDLPADPDTTSGPGRPQGYSQFAFFNLRDSSLVLRSDNENRADSASTDWDIGFQSINVVVNGGSQGPGQGAAYVAKKAFQEVDEVNTDSLDGHIVEDWYTYNANGNNIIRPKPGRTLVVRTADGDAYAKLRILSYYEGAPENPAESDAESRYYTFEYMIQTDGTSFE